MSKRYPSLLSSKEQKHAQEAFASKDQYESRLRETQLAILSLQQKIHRRGLKMIVLFEGPDAAGKGGVIKRLTQYLDPRGVRVHGISKPNQIEAGQHYLERFFCRLPKPGTITLFDRSWYGRVLVERVEKFCAPKEWRRAYDEIGSFEKLLKNNGILVLKYLLDLTHEEQARRFRERERDPLKSWKLTPEDWRNRDKWMAYHSAFKEMLKRTSPPDCPWKVVAADSKWNARVEILEDIEARARRFY